MFFKSAPPPRPILAPARPGLSEATRRHMKRIEITTNKLVDEVFAGKYESLFKGQGMELAEVREYTPGDDVRTIDWNVTARTGRPFVKKFEEERQLTVMLVVDASASQDFGHGEGSKRELASEIAAILAFSALRNNDRVGLLLFTDRVEKYLAPRKGKRHALRLIKEILEPRPEGRKTDLSVALDFLNRVQKRKSLVFVMSDFLGQSCNSLLRLTARRHDLSALRIFDPREEQIPSIGRLRLRDLETGEVIVVDTSARHFQQRYAEAATLRREELRRGLEGAGADYTAFSTAQPIASTLIRFFDRKTLRRRGAPR
jgi:uncharacterized protein (DUF58 family)